MSFPTDRLSLVATSIFCAMMLAVVALGFWTANYQERRETERARPVLQRSVETSAQELAECFEAYGGYGLHLGERRRFGSSRSRVWDGSPDEAEGLRAFNHLSDVGVVIRDIGRVRSVVITTELGRPLRDKEREVIDHCLRLEKTSLSG